MKIFDAHSDILTDVTQRILKGEEEIIKNYHLDKLNKGNIFGAIFVIWVEPKYTDNYEKRIMEIIRCSAKEFSNTQEIQLITGYEEFKKAKNQEKLSLLLGLEGAAFMGENIDNFYMLHQLGVRHTSLTWNEENLLATGVNGDPRKGITGAGKKAIKLIEELGILLDVSHLNERSFWDLAKVASKPFIASHSNAYRLCPNHRNLKDDQIKTIADAGGVIGVNAWPEFISQDNPDIYSLLDHIDYIADLAGIDHVGLGFDFCDFLQRETIDSFKNNDVTTVTGLEDASKAQNLIKALEKRNYSQQDIKKIAYKNFMRVLQKII